MVTLDITFAVLYFMRFVSLETAINEFELDPRGKPNFTEVFVLQENIVSIVGESLMQCARKYLNPLHSIFKKRN